MILPALSVLAGLVTLIWSANRFVDSSATAARHLKLPPLLIGMVVVGFGTSAPEMVVSCIAAAQNSAGIALGNAYGSNITNIALILGLAAAISPIPVHSHILRKELPILTAVTLLTAILLLDGVISRLDAVLLLGIFSLLMAWTIWQGMRRRDDSFGVEVDRELQSPSMPLKRSLVWVVIGLMLLVAASRLLVWGAVEIATSLGISDLIVGLTIIAVGTSLPELASSVVAVRKNQHEIALGNILGSNLFNTLAVIGVAGLIAPLPAESSILTRDIPVMAALTIALFVVGYGFRKQGRIARWEGWVLLTAYVAYTLYLVV